MNDIMKNAVVIDESASWIGIKGAYIGFFDEDTIKQNGLSEPIGDRSLLKVVMDEGRKPWHCHKDSNAIDIAELLQWALDNGYPFKLDTTVEYEED